MAQRNREPPTLTDYVVTALSPTLIMGLVGSLAFFLLDILYAGQWVERLEWTLFFLVFAAVLVSRIGIQIGTGQARAYGAVLGVVSFLAMWRFSGAGLIANAIIIIVVLWSANKLTWDCTYVDETVDDPGGGLLDEIQEEMHGDPASRGRQPPEEILLSKPPGAVAPGSPGRSRPMGRWVVYFSLAALPVFGLGQALIPADDAGRRRYSFVLMTIYIASGLGLLLTTTLLGVRRYLRQRKLQMPSAMTGLWLGVGGGLIAAFLFVAALLPLSHPEYSLIPIKSLGSSAVSASRYAMRSDAAGKGEGRADGQDKTQQAKDGTGGKGQEGGTQAGQNDKPEGPGGDKAGRKGQGDSQSKAGERSDNQRDGGQKGDSADSSSKSSPSPTGVFAAIANVLKWIVVAILAIGFGLIVLWFIARRLSGASEWARGLFQALSAFWRSLFGGAAPASDEIEEAVVVQERPRPLESFRNPFADGTAAGRPADALVRYSFAALEAWAFERGQGRRPDETPLEFADRVGDEVPAMGPDGRNLTVLYARLAYAGRRLPESSRGQVESFWRALEETHTSAGNPARLDSQPPDRL